MRAFDAEFAGEEFGEEGVAEPRQGARFLVVGFHLQEDGTSELAEAACQIGRWDGEGEVD